MLERLCRALHAALQLVDVEIARGHHALPFNWVFRFRRSF
jgi:hypothetical protein